MRCATCNKPSRLPVCEECAYAGNTEGPSLLDALWTHPKVQELVEKGSDRVADIVGQKIDNVFDRFMGGAQQQQQPKEPQPPKESPREILHFSKDEKLDAKKVKERRNYLASLVHPDKGGSVEAMQRINTAAEELLKGL